MKTRPAMQGAVRLRPAPPPLPAEAWELGAMTTREVAAFLSCSLRKVYSMDDLPYGLLDGDRRYPRKLVIERLSAGGER